MHTCKKCKSAKSKSEMSLWGGEVSEICTECRDKMKAARGNGGGSTLRKKSDAAVKAAPTEPATPPAAALELVVEASIGFAAKVDGEHLVVTQSNDSRPDDPDNITLRKSEAKALFRAFESWASSPDPT